LRTLLSINKFHFRKGGADVLYLEHAELFARAGWQTRFFSTRQPENLPCADAGFFADGIDFGHGRPTIGQALSVVWSRGARNRLRSLLDKAPVDIAHVHNIYHHLSPSVLVELKARGIPVVLTAHDLKLICPNYRMLDRDGICERCKGGRLWNPILRRCHQNSLAASTLIAVESALHQSLGLYRRFVDRVVTPSRFYRDKLIEWGWPAEKLVHVPNFVLQRTAVPQAPGPTLLYFGRLAPEKGVATLVRAAAMAGVPVEICGDGPLDGELKTLAASLAAPVTFHGPCDSQEISRRIAAARAAILPSGWYENGPLAAIEAFEAGRPLIGARIGGITELVVEGVTGWSFESGSVTDLARALRLAHDASDADLKRMADACRARFAAEHSESVYRSRIAAIYDALLA
jgi:glycosyltransferase involved in cell wall biosynthesis